MKSKDYVWSLLDMFVLNKLLKMDGVAVALGQQTNP